MPRSTIHNVLHKRLRLTAYKPHILHALQPDDYAKRYGFAVDMLHHLDADEHFLKQILFSDEATFHVSEMVNKHNIRFWSSEQVHAVRELQRSSEKVNVSGMVNKHNIRFWGSEQPHAVRELQRSSEKVNVWCRLLHDRILGPFFFLRICDPKYLRRYA